MCSKWTKFIEFNKGLHASFPSFEDALKEVLVDKKKSSHWIWYIVPYDKPSKTFGTDFIIESIYVDDYLDNTYLRRNYLTIMRAIVKQLETINFGEYSDFIHNHDLKKVYESALMFKETKKYIPIKQTCVQVVNILDNYINGYLKIQNHRKHINRMILDSIRTEN